MAFNAKGTYTYAPKATIKLNGKMVTPEQAAAEWEAKKEACEVWFSREAMQGEFHNLTKDGFIARWNKYEPFKEEYELRPKALKQVKWSDMPVGVAVQTVNKKLVCTFVGMAANNLVSIYNKTSGADDYRAAKFELAPASEQPWIALQEGEDETVLYRNLTASGITYEGYACVYRITGIAKGYVLEGAV